MPKLHIPVHVPAGAKWCHACKSVKLLAEFNLDRNAKDGIRRYCKPCHVAVTLASRSKRRALIDAGNRMTNPARVSAAERDANNAAVIAAIMGVEADTAANIAAIKGPAPTRARKSPVSRRRAVEAAVPEYVDRPLTQADIDRIHASVEAAVSGPHILPNSLPSNGRKYPARTLVDVRAWERICGLSLSY